MKISFLLIILSVLNGFICKSQISPADFDYGRVENDKYVNNYFGFEIMLPINWIVQSKEQLANAIETGKNIVIGDDTNMRAVIKASEVNIANLLAVSQYAKGAAVEYNPSIVIIAENVKNTTGIKKGSDYLFHARRWMMQSQFKYDYLDEQFEKEIISGTDFYKMNAGVNFLGLDIKQIYYTTVLKGFCLNIVISFVNDKQKEELLNSIKSIKIRY